MTDQRMFWMVWNPNGQVPTFQHWSQESADREAERLARQCPGQRFYVLVADKCVEKNDIKVTQLAPECDGYGPPF